MKFPPEGVSSRHEVYWHHNVKAGDDYHCEECQIVFSTGYTFKDVLRVIHPTNLPTIPEWVHEGRCSFSIIWVACTRVFFRVAALHSAGSGA